MHSYRYRDNSGSTSRSIKAIKHLSKIGDVQYVRGYTYKGRYNTIHVGVLVKGNKGSCRFSGFSWGYIGEGTRGLTRLLTYLGCSSNTIHNILSKDWHGYDTVAQSWKINL